MFIKLFRNAGATGHVFCLRNGVTTNKGIAYSGLIGPMTTVAVVPTTPIILDFTVEARTKDKQNLKVTGNLKTRLTPAEAVSKFDFTVDTASGAHENDWERDVRAIVVEQVLGPIHEKARELAVETATQSHKEFEEAVIAAMGGADSSLKAKGIVVESCSIAKVTSDDDVEKAIGATEKQAMLTEADRALHDRRLKAVENDRGIKTYEAETALKLEQDRAKIVKTQGENKLLEAKVDAEATKTRLAAYEQADAGKVFGVALMKMAEGNRIGTLNVGPELLAALQNTNGNGAGRS